LGYIVKNFGLVESEIIEVIKNKFKNLDELKSFNKEF
jgi:hypothetical protein